MPAAGHATSAPLPEHEPVGTGKQKASDPALGRVPPFSRGRKLRSALFDYAALAHPNASITVHQAAEFTGNPAVLASRRD
jgi:hypothetical protein